MNQVNRETIKEVIKEILIEDTKIFKEIIKEILIENQVIISEEQLDRRQKVEKMIEEDFKKYDSVFKDLA